MGPEGPAAAPAAATFAGRNGDDVARSARIEPAAKMKAVDAERIAHEPRDGCRIPMMLPMVE
jgi:hypothetical protein